MTGPLLNRLLITGAAGGLGQVARAGLRGLAHRLRLSDIADLGQAAPHEELVTCDLAEPRAVHDMVAGCDGIVHFGGVSVERDFETILDGNIRGVFNLYEAIRAAGTPRVFLASSNHTIGFYPVDQQIDGDCAPCADTLYGASKVYGEQIAVLYHRKFGIETARVRIGSCFPAPRNRRMLATWLSHRDLLSMIDRVFRTQVLGCPVIYGVSDNHERWWDNRGAAHIGWRPGDSSEPYRAALEAADPVPDRSDPAVRFQGGAFAAEPIHRRDSH